MTSFSINQSGGSRIRLNFKTHELHDIFPSDQLREGNGYRYAAGTICAKGRTYQVERRELSNREIKYAFTATGIDWSDWTGVLLLLFRLAMGERAVTDEQQIQQDFEYQLEYHLEATRYRPAQISLQLHTALCAALGVPPSREIAPDTMAQMWDTSTLDGEIGKVMAELDASSHAYAAWRTLESRHVSERLKSGDYRKGLLSPAGYTQPVIEAGADDGRWTFPVSDGSMVNVDNRIFAAVDEVGPSEKYEVCLLAENLFGSGWTLEQKKLFAASVDRLYLITTMLKNARFELPSGMICQQEAKTAASKADPLTEPGLYALARWHACVPELGVDSNHRPLARLEAIRNTLNGNAIETANLIPSSVVARRHLFEQAVRELNVQNSLSSGELQDVQRMFCNVALTF